jgi:hypothetical protein
MEFEPVTENQLATSLENGWKQKLVPRSFTGVELEVERMMLRFKYLISPAHSL